MARKRKPASRKRKGKARTRDKMRDTVKKRQRIERKLDEGLEETFPASDPTALTDPVRSIKE